MTNRKLHTPYRLVPKSTTWMTLNGPYALSCRKDVSFGAHQKMNEPILSAAKYRPLTLVSDDIRFMRIFAKGPMGGGVTRQWGNQKR